MILIQTIMKVLKWLLKAFLGFLGLILLIYIIGYFQPEKHVVSVTQEVNLPLEKTWNLITEFEKFPKWRPDLKSVRAISSASWIEVNEQGEQVKYEQIKKLEQERLVTQIASKGLPYSGKWIFTLEEKGNTTQLTIEEHGEVYNPIFRFISKFIIGHSSSINEYFEDLKQAKR